MAADSSASLSLAREMTTLLVGVVWSKSEAGHAKIRARGMQCERVIRRSHALSFRRKGILHCFLSVPKKSPSHKAKMGWIK